MWLWHIINRFEFLLLPPWRQQHEWPEYFDGHCVIKLHSWNQSAFVGLSNKFCVNSTTQKKWDFLWLILSEVKYLFMMKSVIFSVNNVQVLEHSYVIQEVLHVEYGCITNCASCTFVYDSLRQYVMWKISKDIPVW